jgi:lipopolysaccharide biosynthesis protein
MTAKCNHIKDKTINYRTAITSILFVVNVIVTCKQVNYWSLTATDQSVLYHSYISVMKVASLCWFSVNLWFRERRRENDGLIFIRGESDVSCFSEAMGYVIR